MPSGSSVKVELLWCWLYMCCEHSSGDPAGSTWPTAHYIVYAFPLLLGCFCLLPSSVPALCMTHYSHDLCEGKNRCIGRSGPTELDRWERYKLHRHKDPTSAVSNKTSQPLPRISLTLLPVSETLQTGQTNASRQYSKSQAAECKLQLWLCVIPPSHWFTYVTDRKRAIRIAELGTVY
jgi:hypothetical protein